jgi:predicted amidophosphoribosyltransferase
MVIVKTEEDIKHLEDQDKLSACCNAPIEKLEQYGGAIVYKLCSKCGRPQEYGSVRRRDKTS